MILRSITSPLRRADPGERNFWIIFTVLIVLYSLFKYGGPEIVRGMFDQRDFARLNALSDTGTNASLGFYLGRIEALWLGPLSMVLSLTALILFGLRYLKGSDGRKFALAIFVYLIITRPEVLFFPSYGEANVGPLAEAVWLFHHNFNYIELARQNSFEAGGPKVYLVSIYPSLVALLMKLIPGVKAFLVTYHILNFVLSATVIAVFRSILLSICERPIALLGSVFLLSLPLYQSMTEAINMEMLCLFFIVLSAHFLIQKRIPQSSVMAVLAALVKGPGALAGASVFLISAVFLLSDPRKKNRWKSFAWGTAALAVGAFVFYLTKLFVTTFQKPAGTVQFLIGWAPLEGSPGLLLLFGGIMIFMGWIFTDAFFIKKIKGRVFFERYYPVIVSFVFALMWLAVYLNVSVLGPRYKLSAMPFLIFCGMFILNFFIRSSRAKAAILLLLVLISSICSYGRFHPKIENYTYTFNEFERSLGYRNDLILLKTISEKIETEFSDFTIGAPFVIAQILATPELGYVKKKLDVVIYGFHVTYGNMRDFEGVSKLNLNRTVWVGLPHEKPIVPDMEYPVDSRFDKVLYEIEVGGKKAVIF